MEAFATPSPDAIRPRAYALKNRERTNRILMLTQHHANQRCDRSPFAETHL